MIDKFISDVFAELNARDVKVGEFDAELVYDHIEGPLLKGTFQPVYKQFYYAFKPGPDGVFTPENLEMAAKRAAYKIEQTLHPERIERQMLEAAMDVINSEKPNVDKEKHEEI